VAEGTPRLQGVSWREFVRGFVGTVAFMFQPTFEQQADAVFAAAPVEEVHLPTHHGRPRASPPPARRTVCARRVYLDEADARHLADSPSDPAA
jgi:hypothetical protein